MALSAALGCDVNMVVSGQRVNFTLTVTNPSNGTACNITLVQPYASPATATSVLGRPLLSVPEAPYFMGAGTSATFQFSGEFFLNQEPAAQSNAPTASFPFTVGCPVYASDGTITTPATITVFAFNAIGVNTATAFSLPIGGTANFAANFNSGLLVAAHGM